MKWYYIVMIVLVVFCIAGIVLSVKMNRKSKKAQKQLEEHKGNN